MTSHLDRKRLFDGQIKRSTTIVFVCSWAGLSEMVDTKTIKWRDFFFSFFFPSFKLAAFGCWNIKWPLKCTVDFVLAFFVCSKVYWLFHSHKTEKRNIWFCSSRLVVPTTNLGQIWTNQLLKNLKLGLSIFDPNLS